jgi:hypothetical protein
VLNLHACMLNLHLCVLKRKGVWCGYNSAQCVDSTRIRLVACQNRTHVCSNHKQSAKITPRLPKSHTWCEITLVCVVKPLVRTQSGIFLLSCVNLSWFMLKSHVSCRNSTRARISHTRACRNHTRECLNHIRECHNHTYTCQNHTLRVEITVVSVVITFVRVKITMHVEITHCVN